MERRNFLKMLGVGAAAVAAPKVARPPEPEPVTATLEETDDVPVPPTSFSMSQWDGTLGLVACTSASFDRSEMPTWFDHSEVSA